MTENKPKLDFANDMSYGDYLELDALLNAQHPQSDDHNELLFVIQHQTNELWMKLMLHELHAARAQIIADQLPPAFKMLARVAKIMAQLVHAWDVLATLTPSEYSAFRPYLGHSSGFQSHQYRQIEFMLGNKNPIMGKLFAHREDLKAVIERELHAPSLYDEVIRLLARSGFSIDATALERDWSQPYAHNESVETAWLTIYQSPNTYWQMYELAEELVDLEDAFRQWRFRHATTVERVIGFKTGTGGTSGVGYLKQMLNTELFPEIWRVRTRL